VGTPSASASASPGASASASGTDFSVDTFRSILCGQQAAVLAKANSEGQGWIEETFDYKNKIGFSTGFIGKMACDCTFTSNIM
jgi:hypothetical protein